MGVFRCLIRSAIGTITLVRHSVLGARRTAACLSSVQAWKAFTERRARAPTLVRADMKSVPRRTECFHCAAGGRGPARVRGPDLPGPTDPHLPPAPPETADDHPTCASGSARRRLGEVRRLRRRSTVWLRWVAARRMARRRARSPPPLYFESACTLSCAARSNTNNDEVC